MKNDVNHSIIISNNGYSKIIKSQFSYIKCENTQGEVFDLKNKKCLKWNH